MDRFPCIAATATQLRAAKLTVRLAISALGMEKKTPTNPQKYMNSLDLMETSTL